MLELIISYFLTKFNIITKKPNNPDCHLNHSVSMAKQNNNDARFLVIFLLRWSDIFDKSKVILKPLVSVILYLPLTVQSTISLGEAEYNCEAI